MTFTEATETIDDGFDVIVAGLAWLLDNRVTCAPIGFLLFLFAFLVLFPLGLCAKGIRRLRA